MIKIFSKKAFIDIQSSKMKLNLLLLYQSTCVIIFNL